MNRSGHASFTRSSFIGLQPLLTLVIKGFKSAFASPVSSSLAATHQWVPRDVQSDKGKLIGEIIAIAVLVVVSGISAGLTLGLMTLDETQLHVLSHSGTEKQRRHAKKILPIRTNGHLLLVSLLLLNVIVNETLPIISEDALGSGIISVVISTVLIVIFSEILPQAICSRHGLAVGAAMAVPVKVLIVIMYVLAWPIAKLLDFLLGQNHGQVWRRQELKELINFHSLQQQHGGDLQIDAVTIMRGALDLQEKIVRNSMTVIEEVFMLHIDERLDRPLVEKIVATGHSRIPIFEWISSELDQADFEAGYLSEVGHRKKIIGCLLVKSLILLDPDDAIPLRRIHINPMPTIQDDAPLFDILNDFQEGRSHLAIVVPSPTPPHTEDDGFTRSTSRNSIHSTSSTVVAEPPVHIQWTAEEMARLEPIGIITLEDVLEELICEEIFDESDAVKPQTKPRAGLAIPLEGGESLILRTNRGRTSTRHSMRPNVVEAVEMRSFSRHTLDTEKILNETSSASASLVRANDLAPTDAKLPASTLDEYAGLMPQYDTSTNTASNSIMFPTLTNKHLRNVGLGRNITRSASKDSSTTMEEAPTVVSQHELRGSVSPGAKNRFKSVSTRSSEVELRRARSADPNPDRKRVVDLMSASLQDLEQSRPGYNNQTEP